MGTRKKRSKRNNYSWGDALRRSIENHPPLKQLAMDHPVKAKLCRAWLERFARAADALDALGNESIPDEFARPSEVVYRNMREAMEILMWLVPPGTKETSGPFPSTEETLTNWVRQGALTLETAYAMKKELEQRPRGRPAETRLSTVAALDAKRTKKLKWKELPESFCDCGREHDEHCTNNLRSRVRELEKFLNELSSEEKS